MPLTITADAATDLPEPLRHLVQEAGGKFVVDQIPDGWGLDHITATRSKLSKAEQDLKRRDVRLSAFAKDAQGTLFDADEFRDLLAEHKRLQTEASKQVDVDALRRQANADVLSRYAKRIGLAESRVAALDSDLDRVYLDAAISDAVNQLGPRAGKAEIVRLMLRERAAVTRDDAGNRFARVRAPGSTEFVPGAEPGTFLGLEDLGALVLRTQHPDLFQDGSAPAASPSRMRGGNYVFNRDDLNGRAGEFFALQAKAKAEGRKVELIDGKPAAAAQRSAYVFKRADLDGKASDYFAMQAKAKATGQSVELVE